MLWNAFRPAAERLNRHSPADIAERSGAVFDAERSCFELQSLGQTIEIAVPAYTFKPEIMEWHKLVALHYLDLADGTDVSGEVISFGELKDGLVRGTKFDRGSEMELQRFLTGKTPEQLYRICGLLGAGFKDDRADICAVFPFFPHYPVWLKIWFADDEFPASGKLFLHKNADHYLTIEDAVTAGEILLKKLQQG